MKGKKIYLAIPYSGVEQLSFEMANYISVLLMQNGYIVFSPISHTHPMVDTPAGKLPGTWEYWKEFDESFINDWADELWVIALNYDEDGFSLVEKSKGVQGEITIAHAKNIPVSIIKFSSEFKSIIDITYQYTKYKKLLSGF